MPRRPSTLSRRRFLASSVVVAASVPMAGCSFFSTDPSSDASGGGPSRSGLREAPQLADRVAAGDLPPLEERLPTRPMVVTPHNEVGRYGGAWRNVLLGAGDVSRLTYLLSYDENLVRWNLDWTEPLPNVAESFEMSDDGRTFTFRLRAGMKWSDGHPFTTDDIAFAYNDILLNAEIYPSPIGLIAPGGTPATLTVTSETEFSLQFEQPNTLFLDERASLASGPFTHSPKHFLQQFHGDYAADAAAAAAEFGAQTWQEFLQNADNIWGGYWQYPDIPRLHAWTPTEALGASTRLRFERNPYYWKTDTDGSQLPYFDEIAFDMVNDTEVLTLKTTAGEVDLMERLINTIENKPVLARDRDSGGYDLFELTSDKVNTMCVMLNLTCQDETKRAVFNDKRFRIALSHAIDRQEIVDVIYRGQGEPWQVAPSRRSPFFDETMASQFLEFDVDRANQILDEAGYDQRDGDGIRRAPNGVSIRFTVDVSSPDLVDGIDMITGYWREIGIHATVNSIESTLGTQRRNGNLNDASVTDGNGGVDVVLTPQYYLPTLPVGYAPAWGTWRASNGADGEQPPEPVLRQFELYDQLRGEASEDERHALMAQVLEIARDEFFMIGVSTPGTGYGVVKRDFGNMVGHSFFAASFPTPGVLSPEQFYRRDGA